VLGSNPIATGYHATLSISHVIAASTVLSAAQDGWLRCEA